MDRDNIYEKLYDEACKHLSNTVAKLDISEKVLASDTAKSIVEETGNTELVNNSVKLASAVAIDSSFINYFQANCDCSIPFGMDGLNILIMAVMELGKASGELNSHLHAICFEGDDFGIHEDYIKQALYNAMVAIAHGASALSVDMSTIIREGRIET